MAGGAAGPIVSPSMITDELSFAHSLLTRLGVPDNGRNRLVIVAWCKAEGGHWHNDAKFNPLNTTQRMPGSKSMNSVGVQSYTSWDQGIDATVKTLHNGHYGPILAALKLGTGVGVIPAIVASPWGTKTIATPDFANADKSIADKVILDPIKGTWQLASKILNTIGSGEFWQRLGIGALGLLVLVIGLAFFMAQEKTNLVKQAVGSVTK